MNLELSNSGTAEGKRSCCGGRGLGGLPLILIPQVARRIKGILVRDILPSIPENASTAHGSFIGPQ